MAKSVSRAEARAWAEEHLRSRPEIGLRKAIANLFLEPRNPFHPQARREFKKDFLFAAGLLAAALGCFAYFNFVR
jgi:hypothetical protein